MITKVCPLCGGEVVEKTVDELVRGDDDVAILTLVAGVCHKCGERIYDAETYREIERLREKLKRNQVGDLKRIGIVYYA
jgi:YgiT-type zinc finger domain-containing protein